MQAYISNLLPRLKSFSESLDKKELFIEKPWVIIDSKGNKEQFIFKRNGRLFVSMNGVGQEGTWEYEKASNGLWIKLHSKNFLLKQGFIDSAVMILKLDGPKENIWCFGNEQLIGNTYILDYIKDLYKRKYTIKTIPLFSNKELYVLNGLYSHSLIGLDVRIEDEIPKSGFYFDLNGNKYKIENGKINDVWYRKTYTVESWPIEFYCKTQTELTTGDQILTHRNFKQGQWLKVPNTSQRIKISGNLVSNTISMTLIWIFIFTSLALFSIFLIVYLHDKNV